MMAVAGTPNKAAAIRHMVPWGQIHNLRSIDLAAELFALGLDTQAVAEVANYADRQVANGQMQRMRRQIGWQAV